LILETYLLAVFVRTAAVTPGDSLELIGRYSTGRGGSCEIAAHDPGSQLLYVTNAAQNRIDVLDFGDPENPSLARTIDLSPYGAGVNSVACRDGLVVAAVEADPKQALGSLLFFDASGGFLTSVTAGALPDMVTFSPDGKYVLSANEGEPSADYRDDPPGSITIVDVPDDFSKLGLIRVRHAGFERFDKEGVPDGVRIFGPGATPSMDLEPEYITVSKDSRTAYVSCQENNALAVVDLESARVTALHPLGFKDHASAPNPMDASDKDDRASFRRWPVLGMYQPDTIASFADGGKTYIVTANEGDAREYDGLDEAQRVKNLTLDPGVFPNAKQLQKNDQIGRLKVSVATGDLDGDGDHDELHAFGARSVSVWSSDGELLWDSGDAIERHTAYSLGAGFDRVDGRSDDKGPEPEALAIGEVGGKRYAFCGLERTSQIAVFDITTPNAGRIVDLVPQDPRDEAPECLLFIPADRSPGGSPLLVAANEVSGSVSVFRVMVQ